MKKQVVSFGWMTSLMVALMAMAISFGFASNANAGEFVITGAANYSYLYNNPDKIPERMDKLATIRNKDLTVDADHKWTDTDKAIKYHGVYVDFQPEYRFVDWFGLGIDIAFGGTVSENYESIHPQWVSSTKRDIFIVDNDFKHLTAEALLTFKFIAALGVADLWFELGGGVYMLVLDYLKDDGTFDDIGEFFDGIYPDARGRLGVTFYPDKAMGIGIHGGANYLGWFKNNTFSAHGGIHFVGKF